ncbi:MerR family transcriptional regulator [Rhodococcus antarcticus]|uniref:MerR family transcriptional regulator n=1 Tax=Rhodococcus antarcticus TaxID=2987751 RepID=A0ABY6P543_9NOCA|nr:MerR family transcriptional regulator [Rhodococcus antarcticus]UZJ26451.1 MerR family transcriptional regulator [Rhodococcus antarcticus]
MGELVQIGDVAEAVGLSLRTIRYYEEMGLVRPSSRSKGGFRLYTDADVARLLVIKRMKPLGFSVDDMRDLLAVRDQLDTPATTAAERAALHERLQVFRSATAARILALQDELVNAHRFADELLHAAEEHTAAGG